MEEKTTNAPEQPSGEKEKKKKRLRPRKRAVALLLLAAIVFVWFFNNYTLKTTRLTLHSDKVKSRVRIAVVSDLHASAHGISNRRIFRRLDKEKPDIVVLLGDMYTSGSDEKTKQIPVDLADEICSAGYRTYFVSGEHDTDPDYIDALSDVGVRVMNYESEVVSVNGNKLYIMGIDNSYYSDTFDLRNEFELKADCYNVLLAHIPNYEKFAKFSADLTICADTHGCMARLPFGLGPIYYRDGDEWFPGLRSDPGEVFDKGAFDYEGGTMFITSGIGDSPAPVRLNNRPEVAIIDIEP